MFGGSLSNPNEFKPITLNQKSIPFIQAIHIENFAKNNAEKYFRYVFELILKIDERLIKKNKQ